MRRREFITLLGSAAAARPNSVTAQSRGRRALVAMLVSGTLDGYSAHVQAFRRGLQKLGYIEGRDLDIIERYSDGDPARLPALAAECLLLAEADIRVECAPDGGQFYAAFLTGCWAWRSSYCAGVR